MQDCGLEDFSEEGLKLKAQRKYQGKMKEINTPFWLFSVQDLCFFLNDFSNPWSGGHISAEGLKTTSN